MPQRIACSRPRTAVARHICRADGEHNTRSRLADRGVITAATLIGMPRRLHVLTKQIGRFCIGCWHVSGMQPAAHKCRQACTQFIIVHLQQYVVQLDCHSQQTCVAQHASTCRYGFSRTASLAARGSTQR